MRLKNLDLVVAMSIAVMNVFWVLLPGHYPVIATVLAVPLVLVLPGYTLTEALFHKGETAGRHRLLLSGGLSLVIAILSGLLLNALPAGLQAISWAVMLAILTLLFSFLALYLRRGRVTKQGQLPRFRFSIRVYVLFGLAAIVASLSILYATSGVARQPHPGFTQFWMLPSIQAGKRCAVLLGVHSFEAVSVTYRITMTMNDTQTTQWSPIGLAPQQEWERLVLLPSATTGGVSIDAQLYRLDEPERAYRAVHVTLHACAMSRGLLDRPDLNAGNIVTAQVPWL